MEDGPGNSLCKTENRILIVILVGNYPLNNND